MNKDIVFNKKDYKSYKDMYLDMAIKLGSAGGSDYYDTDTFDFSADILWEFLNLEFGFMEIGLDIKLIGFNELEIEKKKTFDDYQYEIILSVFKDYVNKFKNSTMIIEDKDDEE